VIPTLGVPLLRGRNFTAAEDAPGGARVVILTEDCWRTRFGASESILGETVLLSGAPTTVIGIAGGPLPSPIAFVELIAPRALEGNGGLTLQQLRSGIPFLQVTARLKPGVSFRQADAEVRALSLRYEQAFAGNVDASNRGELRTWTEEIVGNVRPTLAVLLAAVALVLLIACANVSNLLLGRLTARQKEIAVRLSLGATRGRLVRQFLLETTAFCAIATTLGVLLAVWSLALVEKLLAGRLPSGMHFALDGITLAFTAGISVLACAAIGVLPALHASRANLSAVLKDSARGSPGGVRGSRFRSGLVVAEVALSVLLLVGSGLLLASFLKLQSEPAGFDPRGTATAAINLPTARFRSPAQWTDTIDQVLAELRTHPQIEHAAVASNPPAGFLAAAPQPVYAVQGQPIPPADRRPSASLVIVSEDYFRTLGIPLRAGRSFTRDDRLDAPGVAIVNESFAKKLFPAGDALGGVILRGPAADRAHQIVGIVGDVKSQGLGAPAPDTLYISTRQTPSPFIALVAKIRAGKEPGRSPADAAVLQGILRNAVASVDRTTAFTLFQTLESALRDTFGSQRLVAFFTAIFAGIALVLAALGLYSVLAYTVAQRTNEIGLRMALGATHGQVVGLVLRHGLKLVAVGLVVGLAAAAGTSQLLQKLLFEVPPLNPLIYAAVALLFTAIALLACLLPIRRAIKIDPMVALRAG
jgi:predicted permease